MQASHARHNWTLQAYVLRDSAVVLKTVPGLVERRDGKNLRRHIAWNVIYVHYLRAAESEDAFDFFCLVSDRPTMISATL